MTKTPYARTLTQLTVKTLRLTGDFQGEAKDGRRFSWEEAGAAVNDTVLDIARDMELLKAWGIVTLAADISVYDLPGDCLRLLRVAMHGAEGYVISPASMEKMDFIDGAVSVEGDAMAFFRQMLLPNQLGVVPIPKNAGSVYTPNPATAHGIIRILTEDGAEVATVGTGALRDVRGARFTRVGDGRIVRAIKSTHGNLLINYARSPVRMNTGEDYPDPDFPEWMHKDIPFLVARNLLRNKSDKVSQLKTKAFDSKWNLARANIEAWTGQESTFHSAGVFPM